MKTDSPVFVAFLAVWIALGLGLTWLMRFNRDAAFKRRVFPLFVVAASILFLAFIALNGGSPDTLVFMAPVVGLITFLHLKLTKFCDACGETVKPGSPFSPPKFCPKCGASL